VVYSVRQPDAMVAMLLLGDGDATRRNRTFLLRDDLKVAGVGLADHAKLDSVGVLTLVSMFAINLPEATTAECQGDVTPAFQDVLDAIPSEQARDEPRPPTLTPTLTLTPALTRPSRRATSQPTPSSRARRSSSTTSSPASRSPSPSATAPSTFPASSGADEHTWRLRRRRTAEGRRGGAGWGRGGCTPPTFDGF